MTANGIIVKQIVNILDSNNHECNTDIALEILKALRTINVVYPCVDVEIHQHGNDELTFTWPEGSRFALITRALFCDMIKDRERLMKIADIANGS